MNETQQLIQEVCDRSQPCIEVYAAAAIELCGGQLVLPQRFDARHYAHAPDSFHSSSSSNNNTNSTRNSDEPRITALYDDLQDIPYQQVIIHVEKSRAASIEAALWMWARMDVGARLYVLGANALGIKTTIKKISQALACAGEMVLNKRRSRVHVFEKTADALTCEELSCEQLSAIPYATVAAEADSALSLYTRAGVFSARGLDAGTQLLQNCLQKMTENMSGNMSEYPQRVLDMACGVGHLGLWALRHWSSAAHPVHVHFCDADARSLACVRKSLNDMDARAAADTHVQWWAAGEALKVTAGTYDMVLLNPPAHSGKDQDVSMARCMFTQAWACVHVGGQMCVVANRQLAYEADLRRLDSAMKLLAETTIFKVYLLCKHE